MKLVCHIQNINGHCVFSVLEQEGLKRVHRDGPLRIHRRPEISTLAVCLRGDATTFHDSVVTSPNGAADDVVRVITDNIENLVVREREPERGDMVMVREGADRKWSKRIFLANVGGTSPYVCVRGGYEGSFHAGGAYAHASWRAMKPVPREIKHTVSKCGCIHTWTDEEDQQCA